MDVKCILAAVGIFFCIPSSESHQMEYKPFVSKFHKTIHKECVPTTVAATCTLTPDPAAPFTLTGQVDLQQTHYCFYLGKLSVKASIKGFPESEMKRLRGFHVHQFGDLRGGCASAGGHYNPFNQTHGAPFDYVRHVGDFGNIPVNTDGTVYYAMRDRRANLFGKYSIIGRAIVVHAGRDDLGRGGKTMSPALRYLLHSLQIASFSDFGDYKGGFGHNSGAFSNQCRNTDYSTCVLSPDPLALYNVTGTIYFSQVNDCGTLSDLRVGVQIAGFPDSDDVTKHGLHVHAFGDISEGCSSAGGHYNSLNTMHGGRLDSPGRRHVGDFGNLKVRGGKVVTSFMDPIAKLSGRHSIVGRALVLHAGQDDLGRGGNSGSRASGNAGPRLACCVIGIAEEPDFDKKSDIFDNGFPGRRAPSEIRFKF